MSRSLLLLLSAFTVLTVRAEEEPKETWRPSMPSKVLVEAWDSGGLEVLRSPGVIVERHERTKCLKDWTQVTAWSQFAGFAAVVLSPEDWAQVPDSVRGFLDDYRAAGGIVALDGKVPTIPQRLCNVRKKLRTGLPEALELEASLRQRVPLPVLLAVMLAFAVVAGPVLVFVLALRDRRLHILWLFPVVAIVFTGVLAVAVRLSVGSGLVRRDFTSVRTVGDREVHTTSIVLFAPSAVEGRLKLPFDAFVYCDHGYRGVDFSKLFSDDGRTFDLSQLPPSWPVRFDVIEVKRK